MDPTAEAHRLLQLAETKNKGYPSDDDRDYAAELVQTAQAHALIAICGQLERIAERLES